MARIAQYELNALTTFFQTAAAHLGLYDRKTSKLREGADKEPVFLKNLELFRELKDGGLDISKFQDACRFTLTKKPHRDYLWVTDIRVQSDEGPDHNLIREDSTAYHRMLKRVQAPASRLVFGSGQSEVEDGEISIERVASFTTGELIQYFVSTFGISMNAERSKAYLGAFNHLLASHSLDVILFAIDFANSDGATPSSPLALSYFIHEAEDEVRSRRMRGAS